jgi:hypothetical protein
MLPDFGVGLRRYLFYQDRASLNSEIASSISDQARKYMPYVELINFGAETSETNPNIELNSLNVFIDYRIPAIDSRDSIQLIVSIN